MQDETPVIDAHRARLTRVFARHVVSLEAESLLDVGCGDGLLLLALRRAGIPAQGVEASERRVAAGREAGLDVRQADACALPFEGGAFDWVVIRHVLHHVEDPSAAVREAWRVARTGVVLAEPTTDASIPSQREMARLDELMGELAARSDHVHVPFLSAGELLALAPEPPNLVVLRGYGELTPVPEEEVRALARRAAHGGELDAADLERLEPFVRAAAAGELTYNGSTAVFLHRASGAS